MSWIRGIPCVSGFLKTEPSISLGHCCDVVLLVEDLLLFVEVVQFPVVQRLIEQLEILQASLVIAVFPEPMLSGADVAQHIIDFVVA